MNAAKKIYCRIYQKVFRAALPLLPYRNPVIKHSIEDVNEIMRENKLKRPLLVTDGQIRGLGLTKNLERHLSENGRQPVVYDRTGANPTTEMVMEALKCYRAGECDCIIAFGGGCLKYIGNAHLVALCTSPDSAAAPTVGPASPRQRGCAAPSVSVRPPQNAWNQNKPRWPPPSRCPPNSVSCRKLALPAHLSL